jgi:hypothetical protein
MKEQIMCFCAMCVSESDVVPIATSTGNRDLVVVAIRRGGGSVPPVIAETRRADHIARIKAS